MVRMLVDKNTGIFRILGVRSHVKSKVFLSVHVHLVFLSARVSVEKPEERELRLVHIGQARLIGRAMDARPRRSITRGTSGGYGGARTLGPSPLLPSSLHMGRGIALTEAALVEEVVAGSCE